MRNIIAINEVIDMLVGKASALVPGCIGAVHSRGSCASCGQGKLSTSVTEHVCLPCQLPVPSYLQVNVIISNAI